MEQEVLRVSQKKETGPPRTAEDGGIYVEGATLDD